ncbi:MAG: TolC family outer membrane protein [Deltaproteobacteria bacterium]|nr:TolC family outer membrane protein [Deltaproteobacteria bacterium]
MMTKQLFTKGLLLSVILPFALLAGTNALAQDTKVRLFDTVTTALEYSPRLQVLQANQKAIGFERDRAKGGYYPQVDVAFAYGAEAHSDEGTRFRDVDHNFYDRLEGSIRMSQLLYDGKETRSLVEIEEAKMVSAGYRTFDNAEAIALDAIIAHMEVYRQRELVDLAQMNVDDHIKILDKLEERQAGGVGSIADVDQTQARLARAYASQAGIQAALKSAEANYLRIVGKLAGDIEYFNVPPGIAPKSLDEAIKQTAEQNPKTLALNANVLEADRRIQLSNSNFLPKVHAELSSSYEDNVESSTTYEQNNQAMMRVRWNIFNGHSDVADRKAAMARKMQAAAHRDDQQNLVIEETRATWAELQAARQRVVSFGDALNYDQKTLDSYVKQFIVGQRTLLDVLDAHNEKFQSAGQLVTAKTNEVIAVERLLALTGKLNDSLQIDKTLYTDNTESQKD